MGTLILFNFILIAIISALLFAAKKWLHSERVIRILFLVSPIVTILFHYSRFIYFLINGEGAIEYLAEYRNLLLPIYPCNVVMWCALIYGFFKNPKTKIALLFSDYIFWFGVASTLVGMFANVDFIENPTLTDFEVTKSIVAHATLLFNVLLIPVFGRLRPSFKRNLLNIFISVVAMYFIGLYCNLIYRVLVSAEEAYDVNSMFIIHSPFEALPFLRYPLIAIIGLFIYLIIFTVCDIINTPPGERWFNRAIKKLRKNK